MEHIVWPLAVVLIAIAAFFIYKPALVRLIDRTSKAGKDGVSFERPQEGSGQQNLSLSFADLMKYPISASVIDRERQIKTNFQDYNLKTDTEKIDVLTRALA